MMVPPSYLDSWCITVKKKVDVKIYRGPAWVRARLCKLQKGCTRLAAANDQVYQLLAHGRWFSSGTPTSSPWYSWSIAESGVQHQKSINHLKYTEYNFENRNILRFFLQGISLSICYMDMNWLMPKISVCQVRIWSLLASELYILSSRLIFFQNQSYSHSDDMFIILKSNKNMDIWYIYTCWYLYLGGKNPMIQNICLHLFR